MSTERILILNHTQIAQKLRRIAYQLYEHHPGAKQFILVAVKNKGWQLALRLQPLISEVAGVPVDLLSLTLDKNNPLNNMSIEPETDLRGKSVVLVDDVLNSGKTLMYAARYLLGWPLEQLTTVVLIDRQHRSFPVRADFVGLTLSTTLQDHINVEFSEGNDAAYLV